MKATAEALKFALALVRTPDDLQAVKRETDDTINALVGVLKLIAQRAQQEGWTIR